MLSPDKVLAVRQHYEVNTVDNGDGTATLSRTNRAWGKTTTGTLDSAYQTDY